MAFKRASLKALRWIVWLLLAFVFFRGILSFLPDSAIASTAPPAETAREEPPGVRAFPAQFAREYLTWSPTESDEQYTQRLQPFLTKDLTPGRTAARSQVGQRVQTLWVYALQEVTPTRWLVTVAAELERYELDADGKERPLSPTTLYIAVPIGKTPSGGWVVYDYPTLLPPPAGGEFTEPLHYGQEIADAGDQVKALLSRFFQAYLSGSDADLTYYRAPESNIQAIGSPWSFDSVPKVLLSQTGSGLYALADVVLYDPVTGSRYTNRYTVGLLQAEGRWYVSQILQKGE